MTFTITKGMVGRRIETLGKYSSEEIDKMFKDFFNWKMNADPKKYYVALYERHIIDDKKHQIIIDFGDYSYFGLIKASKKEWPVLTSYRSKPIDLEI